MPEIVRVPGRISLVGLRCGIEGAMELLADVSVGVDLAPAAASDALEDAVDLAALADVVRGTVFELQRTLLETLAVGVARRVLETFGAVEDVDLTVRKTEPAGLDAVEERVQVRLGRSGAPTARD